MKENRSILEAGGWCQNRTGYLTYGFLTFLSLDLFCCITTAESILVNTAGFGVLTTASSSEGYHMPSLKIILVIPAIEKICTSSIGIDREDKVWLLLLIQVNVAGEDLEAVMFIILVTNSIMTSGIRAINSESEVLTVDCQEGVFVNKNGPAEKKAGEDGVVPPPRTDVERKAKQT
ncbi:hypothetical protein OSB04_011768 [Centaurea solstitialis]|uniref:Uncharacterized protein n=1 Tax=Centaurea solstitialis TaxID=347529 RepID=A0AA38TBT6_9ASTR|nr:hypothetical protein OSB04_011768 [Centaurea solstitialis]